MSKDIRRWKSKIINETLALHREYGDAAAPIVIACAEWSEEHPLDGDDARTPAFFKANSDYGSGGVQEMLDKYRRKSVKKLKKKVYTAYAKDGRLGPIDSYCGKPQNKKYWGKAGSSAAVRDFLKYISQVECE